MTGHYVKLSLQPQKQSFDCVVKRLFDVIFASLLLFIFSPLFLIVMYFVKKHDGGGAIFQQKRIGLHGHEFYCLKFRTMVVDAPSKLEAYLAQNPEAKEEWHKNHKLHDDPRVTAIGRFLRKSSLDELPQLWNVIRGEMSLVGPRPIVYDEMSKYGTYLPYYTSVLPGITGLWQISGRSDTTYDERVAMDVKYANSHSIFIDVKILFMTIPSVLISNGAY